MSLLLFPPLSSLQPHIICFIFLFFSFSCSLTGYYTDLNFLVDHGWYYGSLLIDTENSDHIYVFGGLYAGKSIDGGQTWRLFGEWTGSVLPYIHADSHTSNIFYSADGTTKLVVLGKRDVLAFLFLRSTYFPCRHA